MFSFIEALQRGDSKKQAEEHGAVSPQRNSAYLPEKAEDPVSLSSTIAANTRAPSPGLEPIGSDNETLKEAHIAASPYIDSADKEFYKKHSPAPSEGYPERAQQHSKKRRILPWIIVAAVLIIVLAIALGVGLGVGLKKHKRYDIHSKSWTHGRKLVTSLQIQQKLQSTQLFFHSRRFQWFRHSPCL